MQNQYLIVSDISNISGIIVEAIMQEMNVHFIDLRQLEDIYDWVITEAVSRILKINIKHHSNNDLYLCIYDVVGHAAEAYIKPIIGPLNYNITHFSTIKILVSYNNLIISKTL